MKLALRPVGSVLSGGGVLPGIILSSFLVHDAMPKIDVMNKSFKMNCLPINYL
jgi:hypothetical protein